MFKSLRPLIYVIGAFLSTSLIMRAQEPLSTKQTADAFSVIAERGEIILRFIKPSGMTIATISGMISIDDVHCDTIIAYANEAGFLWFKQFNIPFEILSPPSLVKSNERAIPKKKVTDMSAYPSYEEYIALMNGFAADYPDLCELKEFGKSIHNHSLLALKITDNTQISEGEPVILYTSTMHGDETLGYVMMLQLIDFILSNYGTDESVTHLVDNLEIWINPLSNPDGTYYTSDLTVAGSKRFNMHNIDLNRNFPDVRYPGDKDINREPETQAMMDFMEEIRPALSANFHGGAEVVNYPWDTWYDLHADDIWYRMISRMYADTAQTYGPGGYMTYLDNGITNGNAWYEVYGGRQDYNNYFLNGREVTIELSDNKIPPENELLSYWNANRKSLIGYMQHALTGIAGEITDSITGLPVEAAIKILYVDDENSIVHSSEKNGRYIRLLVPGQYHLKITAPDYISREYVVSVYKGDLADLKVKLATAKDYYPNPVYGSLYINLEEPGYNLELQISDMSGRIIRRISRQITSGKVKELKVDDLPPGIYIVKYSYNNETKKILIVKNNR